MEFIRYGSLKPQYHDTTDVWNWIHTPPVEYGIYAFPKGMVETFLLGGRGQGSLQNGRYRHYKDNNGKNVFMSYTEFCNFIKNEYKGKDPLILFDPDDIVISKEVIEYDLIGNAYIKKFPVVIENPPTKFNYNGLIWHHLYKEKNDKFAPYYLKRIGYWVLSDIKTYEKCLKRAISEYCYRLSMGHNKYCNGKIANHLGFPKNFSKDEFEVYIEKL